MSTVPIRKAALTGVLWSLVQNWGTRLSTFVIFILLARFLTPAEIGLVSAALMVILFIGVVADFGFADAIVQRQALKDEDINLPFCLSVGFSCLLALGVCLFSETISTMLRVEGLSQVLWGLALVAPMTTMAAYQEAIYKRQMRFRTLAARALAVNVIAGLVAIACAHLGFGSWSLVIQTLLATLIGLAWLWLRPQWRPTMRMSITGFFELGRFGISVLTMRLLDFFSVRYVEYIIITSFGVATFGIYAVGSRLYQILMLLLQSALNDVSLVLLSRIADDTTRVARIYLETVSLAAFFGVPFFVLLSAISAEVTSVLFGSRWAGVDAISQPLLLVGAVQCVQNLNGLYLNARGKPHFTLIMMTFKVACLICIMLVVGGNTAAELAYLYVYVQILTAPLSFHLALRELNVPTMALLDATVPPALASAAAFCAVVFMRQHAALGSLHPFIAGALLGLGFALVYLACIVLFARRQARATVSFILTFRGKSADA